MLFFNMVSRAERLPVITVLLGLLLILGACSKFTRLEKTPDVMEKYAGAVAYYEKKDYYRAGILLEQCIPLLRGTEQSERAQFYRAYCTYHRRELILSSYHFKTFAETYPRSALAEEAYYMYCVSLMESSAPSILDQSSTEEAMDAINTFLTNYPDNPNRDRMVTFSKKLDEKLMKKDWDNTYLYFKTMRYKAAAVAIDNFLEDYPDGPYTEEAMYTKVLTLYQYAKNSIDIKQKDRFQQMMDAYLEFVDRFPNSKKIKELERIYLVGQKEVQSLISSKKP